MARCADQRRTSSVARRRLRGLTLIELLAVCALLALLSAWAIVGIVGASSRSALRAAESIVVDVDAKARAAALRGGPVSIKVGADELLLLRDRIAEDGTGDEEVLLRATLPDGVRASVGNLTPQDAFGRREGTIVVTADGRSVDYVVTLERERERRSVAMSGLTGLRSSEDRR